MVIVCPECSTRFRVNPERIPESGAKVRCARCKHVFLAQKTVPPIEPEVTTETGQLAPETVAMEPPQPAPQTENPVAANKTADQAQAADEDDDFSYDQFREQEEIEDKSFTFSAVEESEVKGSEAQVEAAEETPEPRERPGTESASGLTAARDDALGEAFRPAEEAQAAQAKAAAPAPEKPTKRSPFASLIRLVLLLILGILLIGAVVLYMNGPEQLEQAVQQLLGQNYEETVETGEIVLQNLQGKFISNKEAGELFVIRGVALNKFKDSRASIQVKGTIYDQTGKPLLQKTIFCGNPIDDMQLRSLSFSKIEEMMGNQFGESLSNMNVNSGQTIPFAIVFRDLPATLTEFSVKVTSSKPASE